MALKTVWTIGYERTGVRDLVTTLKEAKIKRVLDVRELPNSRRAGFSKNMLAASLEKGGIAYQHMKALGTPKAGRDAAKRGDTKTMHKIFEAKMQSLESQMALAEAAKAAGKERTALLCLEHDWKVCHRAIVAKHLEGFGFKAQHLAPEMHD